MLAVLLAQVKMRGLEDIGEELEFLLESGDGVALTATSQTQNISVLSPEQAFRLENFAKQSIFKPVQTHIAEHESEWASFLEAEAPERQAPTPWEPSTRKSCKLEIVAFSHLLVQPL